MPARSITYDPISHDYALALDGQFVGYAKTYVRGEEILDQIAHDRENAPAQRIAQLAVEANKARSEGRMDDYAALKRQAIELKARELGIEYSVFCEELEAYQASKKAAA